MTNGQWLGDHKIDGYALYSLGLYPGVIAGSGQVACEVYRIDASTLGELDALRTKGGEYKRELVQTPYGSAWLYVYQRSIVGREHIVSGDWLQQNAPKPT
jgi:gamma-glutamylcyclotransferase (GGCT)/AIG2-like uncharacterized protein YtfP